MTWTGEYFKCNQCGEIYPYRIRHCPFCGCSCICIKASSKKTVDESQVGECERKVNPIKAVAQKPRAESFQIVVSNRDQQVANGRPTSTSTSCLQTLPPSATNANPAESLSICKRVICAIALIIVGFLVTWLTIKFVWPVLCSVFGWIGAVFNGILWVIKAIWTVVKWIWIVITWIFKPIIYLLAIFC